MTAKKPMTAAQKREARLLRVVRAEMRSAAQEILTASPYKFGYSVMTIRFAPGSVPAAISLPYQAWDNSTELSLPYRLVKEEVPA